MFDGMRTIKNWRWEGLKEELAELSREHDLFTGVLSKAKGQTLRVAAALYALLNIGPPPPKVKVH